MSTWQLWTAAERKNWRGRSARYLWDAYDPQQQTNGPAIPFGLDYSFVLASLILGMGKEADYFASNARRAAKEYLGCDWGVKTTAHVLS